MLRYCFNTLACIACGIMLLGLIGSMLMTLFNVGMLLAFIFFTLKGLLLHWHQITACGDLCPR